MFDPHMLETDFDALERLYNGEPMVRPTRRPKPTPRNPQPVKRYRRTTPNTRLAMARTMVIEPNRSNRKDNECES